MVLDWTLSKDMRAVERKTENECSPIFSRNGLGTLRRLLTKDSDLLDNGDINGNSEQRIVETDASAVIVTG